MEGLSKYEYAFVTLNYNITTDFYEVTYSKEENSDGFYRSQVKFSLRVNTV